MVLTAVFLLLVGLVAVVRAIQGQDRATVVGGPVHVVEHTVTATAPTQKPTRARPSTTSAAPARAPARTVAPTTTTKPQAITPKPQATTPKPSPTTTRPAAATHLAVTTTRAPATTKPRVAVTTTKSLCGAPQNPMGYNFCGGTPVVAPASNTCDYFRCIANFDNGKGYMEECRDGTYSMSGGRRGACSYHGGELRPVDD
ncbi:MAG: hypothetical protein QOE24_2907 [Frankiales bacterium]|nr:hypothetical protein [Frankiales bacterium]